jgi:hypothetical protein
MQCYPELRHHDAQKFSQLHASADPTLRLANKMPNQKYL